MFLLLWFQSNLQQKFLKVITYSIAFSMFVFCFDLIWASGGIPVIQYWPALSCMSYMEACADMS